MSLKLNDSKVGLFMRYLAFSYLLYALNKYKNISITMVKFVHAKSFDEVFLIYDIKKGTATFRSDELDKESIVFINDPVVGDYIYTQGKFHVGNSLGAGTGITINDDIINANSNATTTKAIVCSTGAPVDARSVYPNGIPKGTSVQEILEKLLCKEIFPDAATPPSISLSGNNKNMGYKEIGSHVDVPAITMNKNNGQFNPTEYDGLVQNSVGTVTWSNESITITDGGGFTGYNPSSGTTSIAKATGITIALGTNKRTYSASAKYSAPSNKPITNLGNETESKTKISLDGSDLTATWSGSTAYAQDVITQATGVYPCFVNIKVDDNQESSTYGQRILTSAINSNSEKIIPGSGSYSTSSADTIYLTNIPKESSSIRFKFAFPANRNVQFYGQDTGTGYGLVNTDTYTTEDVENFYGNKTYTVVTASKGDAYYSSGMDRCYFKLSKNLSKD